MEQRCLPKAMHPEARVSLNIPVPGKFYKVEGRLSRRVGQSAGEHDGLLERHRDPSAQNSKYTTPSKQQPHPERHLISPLTP